MKSYKLSHKSARRFWRKVSLPLALMFLWSSTLAVGTQAWASQQDVNTTHNSQLTTHPIPSARLLTAEEMHNITGAQSPTPPLSPDSGGAYAWEGTSGDVNTATGNKHTQIPIVGWTARGGMPVQFTLYHNSQGAYNAELGQKWTHSYDIYLVITTGDSGDTAAIHWGSDLAYTFTKNMDGSWSPPTGIHDILVTNGSPATSYDLTTPNQVKYHFTNPNSTGWYCDTLTDRNSNVITLNRNGSNYVTSIVDPNSRTITITYTSNKISSISDPLSRSWSFTYTGSDLTQVTWPTVGGNSYNEQFAYDANSRHRIVTRTDKRAHTWTATYNSDDSVASETDSCSNATTFGYTASAVTITDANSHAVVHNYSSGKLSGIVDQLSNTESYSYDASNNRTGLTDRRSHSYSFTFDGSGNMLTKTDPLSHVWTWTYSAKNDVASLTDPLSNKVVNSFDTPGNLTQVQEKDSGNNVKATTTFAYDGGGHGLLVTKTDNNSHATTYGNNTNGELTSVTTPNSRVTSWTVNTLGVRLTRVDALSNTTTYTLDNWNRVTAIDYPSGTDPTFTFDACSNLTGWTDAVGTWTRVYDNDNRITSETLGGNTLCSYVYDATNKKGLLSTATDANSRTITYAYTSRNQLYTVVENSGTTTYSYDVNGNETGVTLPNTATVANVFDDADRLTSVTNKNSTPTTLSSFTYTYGSDNRRADCTESNGDVVSWGYDAQGHLTSEGRTGANAYSASYTVDGVGNRTSQTIGTKTTSFTLNTDDELTATSSSTGGFVNSYTYNNAGDQTNRTLSGTSWTLAYDFEGQLTSTVTGGNTISTFVYDALGRRYSRANGGTTTVFYYGPGGILTEKQGANFTSAYAYGNGMIRKDTEYPMFDGLGSERTVTNGSQTVTGTIIHDAFGLTVATTGSSTNPYKFAANSGYRDDGDCGLTHVGARYYDSQVGRFVTRDTYLLQHPFLYCQHDPVNALDPSGHLPMGWWLFGYQPWHGGSGGGYIDINISAGFGLGITFGVQITPGGKTHPYLGWGLVTPGAGGAVTWSPSDPSPGELSVQAQVAFGGAFAVGEPVEGGSPFYEVGAGTPGASLTLYYTW